MPRSTRSKRCKAARLQIMTKIRHESRNGLTSDLCKHETCEDFPSQIGLSHAGGKCQVQQCMICPVDTLQRAIDQNPRFLLDLWDLNGDKSGGSFDKFRERIAGPNRGIVSNSLVRCFAAFIFAVEAPKSKEWQTFIRLCLDDNSTLNDQDLPLSPLAFSRYFPGCNKNFLDTQYHFCPVDIRQDKFKLSMGNDTECYRPYTILGNLGAGAYGTVHKVEFTSGCFCLADKKNVYAVKHIRTKNGHAGDSEWTVAQTLLNCHRQHTGIMRTLAAVRSFDYLSLFYDLAECDLKHFMDGGETPPTDFGTRRKMLSKMADVADALSFLHDGLRRPDGTQIKCYHLDLKPSNILVVKGEDMEGGVSFKLADFGISTIKEVKPGRSTTKSELRSLFDHQTSESKSVDGTRGCQNEADMCLAPEASMSSPCVDYRTDVWSYSAILSIFVAWVWNGPKGIADFAERRRETHGAFTTDQFFSELELPVPGPIPKFKRREGVDAWFVQLRKASITGREQAETSLYRQLWHVIEKGLEPEVGQLPPMQSLYALLNDTFNPRKAFDISLRFPKIETEIRGGARPKMIDHWRYIERTDLHERLFSFCGHNICYVLTSGECTAPEIISGRILGLQKRLNTAPDHLALVLHLYYVLAYLKSPCNVVDLFLSASKYRSTLPNQASECTQENVISFFDGGPNLTTDHGKVQAAVIELQSSHFLTLQENHRVAAMDENTQSATRAFLVSRQETSKYWLEAARLLALGHLGRRGTFPRHGDTAIHAITLLSFQPEEVEMTKIHLVPPSIASGKHSPTTVAETFADLFSACGFLQPALSLRKSIFQESLSTDSLSTESPDEQKSRQILACAALAHAYGAVERWSSAITCCEIALNKMTPVGHVEHDIYYYNNLNQRFEISRYLWRFGNTKEAREALEKLNQRVEQAWEDTGSPEMLRLWMEVARECAKILTENASSCEESRRLLEPFLKSHQSKHSQDSIEPPPLDHDLLCVKADLADACFRAGSSEEALRHFEEILVARRDSPEYYIDIMKTHQSIANCHSRLGDVVEVKRHRQAVVDLLDQTDPDDERFPTYMKHNALCELANAYQQAHDFREAQNLYSKVWDAQSKSNACKAPEIFHSKHAMLVSVIEEMRYQSKATAKNPANPASHILDTLARNSKATLGQDAYMQFWHKDLLRRLAFLGRLIEAASLYNPKDLRRNKSMRYRLEDVTIKAVECNMQISAHDGQFWPNNRENYLGMIDNAIGELKLLYRDAEREFGDTNDLTLGCAQAIARSYFARAKIVDEIPSLEAYGDPMTADAKLSLEWWSVIIDCIGPSGSSVASEYVRTEVSRAKKGRTTVKRHFGIPSDRAT